MPKQQPQQPPQPKRQWPCDLEHGRRGQWHGLCSRSHGLGVDYRTFGVVREWDVTADVQDFINGSASNFGWFLINTTEATTSRKLFYSRQASTDAGYEYRPQLVVTWE